MLSGSIQYHFTRCQESRMRLWRLAFFFLQQLTTIPVHPSACFRVAMAHVAINMRAVAATTPLQPLNGSFLQSSPQSANFSLSHPTWS